MDGLDAVPGAAAALLTLSVSVQLLEWEVPLNEELSHWKKHHIVPARCCLTHYKYFHSFYHPEIPPADYCLQVLRGVFWAAQCGAVTDALNMTKENSHQCWHTCSKLIIPSPIYGTDEETNKDLLHVHKPISTEVYGYLGYDYFCSYSLHSFK